MSNDTKKLKSGYTTGTHATAVFKASLMKLFNLIDVSEKEFEISTPLPNGTEVHIQIESCRQADGVIDCLTIKSDNDDLDVTKGCKIHCYLSTSKKYLEKFLNPLKHNNLVIKEINRPEIFISAGKGIGIVTKKGLKVPTGYPAINPVPIQQMTAVVNALEFNDSDISSIEVCFEIEEGEKLAKQTANPKIGILNGLSILGTTGIVKPISVRAYLETIETELSVAHANQCPIIIFTLGNSSLHFSEKHFNVGPESIIEIGNYIYDSLNLLKNKPFIELYFVANLGKMVKLAQENKNTHNQYGKIDFELLKSWVIEKLPELKKDIENLELNTTSALTEYLFELEPKGRYINIYYDLINHKAVNVLKNWYLDLHPKNKQLKYIHTLCIKDSQYWQSSCSLTE